MHTSQSSNHPLTVRVAQADDRKALRRLALLDSRRRMTPTIWPAQRS